MATVAVPGTVSLNTGNSGGYKRRRYGMSYKQKKLMKKGIGALRRVKAMQREWRKTVNGYPWARGSKENIMNFGSSWKDANPTQRMQRSLMRYKGAGDYKSVLKWISRIGGGVVGAADGFARRGMVGALQGGYEGYQSGAGFSRRQGWGDYGPVSENQIMGGQGSGADQQQIAVNQNDNSGDLYIAHTEFVQNITATCSSSGVSPFEITEFPINPGLSVTFPFASQIAQNYALYEPMGIIFQYKPTSGEYGSVSGNALGKVILATNYDPDADAFINSVQMENYDYANSSKPSCGILHGIECMPDSRPNHSMYVRTGTSQKSLIFTDIGNFFVATEGVQGAASSTQIIGELWVTYKFRLSRANLFGSLLGSNIAFCNLLGTSSAAACFVSTYSQNAANSLDLTISNVNSTALKVTFPKNISLGTFLVVIVFQSGATVFTTQTPVTTTVISSCTYINAFSPGYDIDSSPSSQSDKSWLAPQTQTSCSSNNRIAMTAWVTVTAPGNLQASFNFNVSAALTDTTTWNLYCTQINQATNALFTGAL